MIIMYLSKIGLTSDISKTIFPMAAYPTSLSLAVQDASDCIQSPESVVTMVCLFYEEQFENKAIYTRQGSNLTK